MANVFSTTHRAANSTMAIVANLAEAGEILSESAIPMAKLQRLEARAELEAKEQELYSKYPNLRPITP